MPKKRAKREQGTEGTDHGEFPQGTEGTDLEEFPSLGTGNRGN